MAGTSSDADVVVLEIGDDGVAVVSLHRPEALNIYNLDMRDALIETFAAVRDHPEARVLLLRADGKHFSAGADLGEFGTAETIFEARRIRRDRDPWMPLWELPQPTIAALHGYALGAGLEMALLCDIRLGSTDTKVGLPETKLGMLPSAGGTQSLARAIGRSAALPLVLGAHTIDAAHARRVGILHQVVEDVEAESRSLAAHIAALPPSATEAVKRAVRQGLDGTLANGLALERVLAEAIN